MQGMKNITGWSPVVNKKLWLTHFPLTVWELAFGVLAVSLHHMWHRVNGRTHVKKSG
jgi:hypothetical protein